jgi:hypothetical protein
MVHVRQIKSHANKLYYYIGKIHKQVADDKPES